MPKTRSYALTFEALAELATEIHPAKADASPDLPSLEDTLAALMPIPPDTLFLGIANDGLPLLLNLSDPVPGPILIAGEKKSGKTRFLQTLATGIDLLPAEQSTKYIVLTEHQSEWLDLKCEKCEGIFPFSEPGTARYLTTLVAAAHHKRSFSETLILLIDNFEELLAQQNDLVALRWLFLRGPASRIWPVVSMDSSRARDLKLWLHAFHTRLFGSITNIEDLALLTGEPTKSVLELAPGTEFAMLEHGNWLNFWIPTLN